jgi:hypothetical protein
MSGVHTLGLGSSYALPVVDSKNNLLAHRRRFIGSASPRDHIPRAGLSQAT